MLLSVSRFDAGLGALISPLVSTQFAKSDAHWSLHYVTSDGVYVGIVTVLWFVFRGKRQEGLSSPPLLVCIAIF